MRRAKRFKPLTQIRSLGSAVSQRRLADWLAYYAILAIARLQKNTRAKSDPRLVKAIEARKSALEKTRAMGLVKRARREIRRPSGDTPGRPSDYAALERCPLPLVIKALRLSLM